MTDWSIFAGNGPNVLSSDVPISLGVEWFVTQPNLYIKGMRFYKGDVGITGSPVGRTSRIDGPAPANTPLAGTDINFGSINAEAIGWVRRDFALPVGLLQSQHYKTFLFMPANYTATAGYWTGGAGAAGLVNGPLTAPNSAGSQDGQCSFKTGASLSYPDSTFGGGNFWVDVIITDNPGGGGGMGQTIQDVARQRMLTQLALVEPQNLSNADLMKLVLEFPGQVVITKTDATAGVHLHRLLTLIAKGG